MKYLLILIVLFASCRPNYQKPFIIVKKRPSTLSEGKYYYEFQDSRGFISDFTDIDRYNLGDTIR